MRRTCGHSHRSLFRVQAFSGKGNLPALEEELRCLRVKDKHLQMERDI